MAGRGDQLKLASWFVPKTLFLCCNVLCYFPFHCSVCLVYNLALVCCLSLCACSAAATMFVVLVPHCTCVFDNKLDLATIA